MIGKANDHSFRMRPARTVLGASLLFLLSVTFPSLAEDEFSTDDGLSISVDNGRVDNLTIGGQTIAFGGETGGFYVRDYTLDPNTGLPKDLDTNGNLLGCSTFEGPAADEPECTECLEGEGIWTIAENVPGNPVGVCTQLDK